MTPFPEEPTTASPAGPSRSSGARRSKGPPKLPDKSRWPKYTPDQQSLILAYLAAHERHAEEAERRARAVAEIAPDEPGTVGQLAYWRNVRSGFRWLMTRVGWRQQHLAIAEYVARHGEQPP